MKESPLDGIILKAAHSGKWVAVSSTDKKVVSFSANLATLTKKLKDNKNILYVLG